LKLLDVLIRCELTGLKWNDWFVDDWDLIVGREEINFIFSELSKPPLTHIKISFRGPPSTLPLCPTFRTLSVALLQNSLCDSPSTLPLLPTFNTPSVVNLETPLTFLQHSLCVTN
jgi:hypothetical protein